MERKRDSSGDGRRPRPAVRDPFTPNRNIPFEALAGSVKRKMNPL